MNTEGPDLPALRAALKARPSYHAAVDLQIAQRTLATRDADRTDNVVSIFVKSHRPIAALRGERLA